MHVKGYEKSLAHIKLIKTVLCHYLVQRSLTLPGQHLLLKYIDRKMFPIIFVKIKLSDSTGLTYSHGSYS